MPQARRDLTSSLTPLHRTIRAASTGSELLDAAQVSSLSTLWKRVPHNNLLARSKLLRLASASASQSRGESVRLRPSPRICFPPERRRIASPEDHSMLRSVEECSSPIVVAGFRTLTSDPDLLAHGAFPLFSSSVFSVWPVSRFAA